MRLLLLLLMAVPCAAEEIPLSEVWSSSISETKDIRDLESRFPVGRRVGREYIDKSLVMNSLANLGRPKRGEPASRSFLVASCGEDALTEAASVLAEKGQAGEKLGPADCYSAIVYCRLSGMNFKIDSIARGEDHLKIKWHFESHRTTNMTNELVVIPLGKVVSDEFDIIMIQTPSLDHAGKPTDTNMSELPCVSGPSTTAIIK